MSHAAYNLLSVCNRGGHALQVQTIEKRGG